MIGSARLEQLDALSALLGGLLRQLAEDREEPDLVGFERSHRAAVGALRRLGPVQAGDGEALRARLRGLQSLTAEAIEALGALRYQTGLRLSQLHRGRQGIAGYGAALAATLERAGARRAIG